MTRRFSTTTKLPSLLPVAMSYRILGWGRCTSLVGTRRMPPSALRKFSLHSREITRLWRFWDLFMQIQVTRRRGRQLGYVCEFEEEGGMVCVWPWRRGRQLGYVCVTLKKREAARVCVCDLVYRTLGMLLVSGSIPWKGGELRKYSWMYSTLSSHPNRTTWGRWQSSFLMMLRHGLSLPGS